jgi:hypothetical protein
MKKYSLVLLITFFSLITLKSQNIAGINGLLTTPYAEFKEDKTITVGGSFLSKKYLEYGDYQYDAWVGYINLTFLPFVELSFRYTGQLREISREKDNFPDRMPSLKLRVLKESKIFPSIAIGFQDFTSSRSGRDFGSEYLVFTKNFNFNRIKVLLNSGYAFTYFHATGRDHDGLFYGFSFTLQNFPELQLLVDYDSRRWNAGIKILLVNRLQLIAALRGFKTFEGGLSYSITLK